MELNLDEVLKKGLEAHKDGKLQEADRHYRAILKIKPKHPDANHNMGILAVSFGKIQEALPFFKIALETNSNNPKYWLSCIDTLIKLNLITDAKAVFDEAKSKFIKGDGFEQIEKRLIGLEKGLEVNVAFNKSKEPPEDQLQNLIKLHTQGLFQKALVQCLELLKYFPESFKLYNIIGATNKDQGKLDEAIESFNKALLLNPDYAEAHNNMGIVLQDQGKLEKAIGAYKKAVVIEPDFAEAYNNMGTALKEQGKLDKAIVSYSKALAIKPDYAKAHNNLGIALKKKGKLVEAIEAFKKALFIKPYYSEAFNNMGVALKNQGKLKEAVETFKNAISTKPDYTDAHYNMGNALQDQGKLEEAIKSYNNALSIKPDFAEALNNIGNALNDQGKLEEAIEAFKKAILMKPDYATAQHMLSALTGNTNETAPREYVENLFDNYAKKFETSLLDKLGYKTPKLIRDILIKINNNETLGSLLDLGCGTGLLGSEIKNYCSKLEGIDLSNEMLTVAKQKNVYDKLSQFDIVEYLSSMPLGFDYYLALDVFIYVGELTEIFRLIKSRNKKPGHLVFSTEHTEKDGYHLLRTLRYSHSKSYIESLCKKFDYNISHFSTNDLRKEKGDFITGGIYVLSFKP